MGGVLGLLAVTLFALTLPATHLALPHFDPIFIGLGRATTAAGLAIIILLLDRRPLPSRQQLRGLCWVAAGVVIGFPVLSALAMQSVPAAHGAVVMGILPISTALVGTLLSNERPSIGFWLVGLAGAIIVISYSLLDGAGRFQNGDLLLTAAIISAAVGYAVGAQLAKEMGGQQVICWALLIALPFTIIPTWLHAPESFIDLPQVAIGSFLYLAIISQLLGFFIWYHGLALGGVARVSQTQLLQPFITIIASAFLLDESLNSNTIGFALLVIITVAISRKMQVNSKSIPKKSRLKEN